jgi:hypothetical protein
MKRDTIDRHAEGIPAECWAPKHRDAKKPAWRIDYEPMTVTAVLSSAAFLTLFAIVMAAWLK